MKKAFTVKDKIGEIVSRYPGAADIFKKYKIDFCCGGDRQLELATKEGNLNEKQILKDLNEKYQKSNKIADIKDISWKNKPLSDLINHIVNKHHGFLQENLAKISDLTTTTLRAHGKNHRELAEVHKLFHYLKMELEQHLIKEEEVLFPVVKKYEENVSTERLDKIFSVINELEDEHEGAGDILKELRDITEEYTIPDDGCSTYQLTYQLLVKLESDLFQHIHLENNILFPRLEKERVTVQ